MPHPPATSL